MLKSLSRRIYRKATKPFRANSIPTAPKLQIPEQLKGYAHFFVGKKGLEVGGPSDIFKNHGDMPVYSVARAIDGCNFSTSTIWEGDIREGFTYQYEVDHQPGYQYISEATDLSRIENAKYDFVLSSHCIEHTANPLKAVYEWLRVIKNGGALLMVVPHKDATFDHKRPVTHFSHLLEDYHNGTAEEDLTHLPEILALHDLDMDLPAGNLESFERRSRDNFKNRCLHQHVFDTNLVLQVFDYFKVQVVDVRFALPYHIILLGVKTSRKGFWGIKIGRKADNKRFYKTYKIRSPFPTDQK